MDTSQSVLATLYELDKVAYAIWWKIYKGNYEKSMVEKILETINRINWFNQQQNLQEYMDVIGSSAVLNRLKELDAELNNAARLLLMSDFNNP